jgi:hypothetical protein
VPVRPTPKLTTRLAAAVALCLMAPAGATAATVSVDQASGTLTYAAAPGELNNLRLEVQPGGGVHVSDLSAPLTAGAGCTADGQDSATCSSVAATRLLVNTGDLDDSVDVSAGALPAEIDGGAGTDLLRGGTGADVLRGGAGDDVLDGRAGADQMSGGDGVDTADYAGRTAGVRVDVDTGADDGEAGEGDTVVEIENVNGGTGADTLVGAAGRNVLSGGAGNDTLAGGDGEDALTGGPGVDTFDAGAGNDTIDSRDSSAERVTCGADVDVATSDSSDELAADCENVTREGAGGGGPTPPAQLNVSLTRLGTTTVAMDTTPRIVVERRSVVAVDITCLAPTGRCVGELKIVATRFGRKASSKSGRTARRSRPTTVGTKKFDLAKGEKRRVRVTMSRRSRPRLLDKSPDDARVEVRQKSGSKRLYGAKKIKIRAT